jgi:hypothetical protein
LQWMNLSIHHILPLIGERWASSLQFWNLRYCNTKYIEYFLTSNFNACCSI